MEQIMLEAKITGNAGEPNERTMILEIPQLHETFEETLKAYGKEKFLAGFNKSGTISVQSPARGNFSKMEKDGSHTYSPEQVQAKVNEYELTFDRKTGLTIDDVTDDHVKMFNVKTKEQALLILQAVRQHENTQKADKAKEKKAKEEKKAKDEKSSS